MNVTVPTVHPKLWGTEREIVTTDQYTGKILDLNPGHVSSIHRHRIKEETFYIDSGVVLLEFYDENGRYRTDVAVLSTGQAVTISPGTYHAFRGLSTARILEFSTSHHDSDVERAEPSRPLRPDERGAV